MNAEHDEQLLQIVSDALRDGPGTPAWEEAKRLVDTNDGDELDALYRARQRLESGKRWREVRPGIGFTRKVMDAVDQQCDASARPTGPATIIAILCGLLVVVVIAALVPMLFSHAKAPPATVDEFKNVYFATPWLESAFENSISGDWRTTGKLSINASHGLSAAGDGDWGIISTQSLSADQFFAFDAKVELPADESTIQFFVTDQKNELAAVVDKEHVRVVLPGGETAFTVQRSAASPMELRWLVGPASAALELNGQRIWAGANNLAGDQPRFIGVRCTQHDKARNSARIETITVRTKS